MAKNIMGYFDHSFIMVLTLVFMAIGILYQASIGIVYQRMIHATDTLGGVENKLMKRCKERFINCYKLNGGVANISVFVDKFINRLKFMGMSIGFIRHLSGQLMLAGVFIAGFGVCKGIMEGQNFVELLPFYIISLFGIYIYLSVASVVDMPARRQMLKTNLTDYLENHVAQRLEHGIMEKEKLMWELSQEKNANDYGKYGRNKEQVSFYTIGDDEKSENSEYEEDVIGDRSRDKNEDGSAPDNNEENIEKGKVVFSKEEAEELEALLRSYISTQ